MTAGIVIAGGGLAAQRCCETLRARGYDRPIRMVCAEPHPPYDRPPLSKQVLAGAMPEPETALRPRGWYDDHAVELLLEVRARALYPGAGAVALSDGRELRYDRLLIATGGRARRLPALEGFTNVDTLRTRADARALRAELEEGARLAVIGAGFIGLEVAATARGLGVEVTVVEALEAPLVHVLGAGLGRWLAELHRSQGVDLLTRSRLDAARGNGRVEELVLADGRRVACDAVLVGIGMEPEAGWLAGTGLGPDGVRTDSTGRTRLRHVYAAGDVARPLDPLTGAHGRTEHWDAAARQGATAAQAMLGVEPGAPAVRAFWSDQYGIRMQLVGDPRGTDGLALDGDPAARDFSVLLSRDGRPVAGFAAGRPRAAARLRRAIEQARSPDPESEAA